MFTDSNNIKNSFLVVSQIAMIELFKFRITLVEIDQNLSII